MILISGNEIEQDSFSAGELKIKLTPFNAEVPVIIKFELPNPTPSSDSCNISKTWFVNRPSS